MSEPTASVFGREFAKAAERLRRQCEAFGVAVEKAIHEYQQSTERDR